MVIDAHDVHVELSGDGYERESVGPLIGWGEWAEVECWKDRGGHAVYYFIGPWPVPEPCAHAGLIPAVNYAPGTIECRDCGALWVPWTAERGAVPEETVAS